MRFVKFIKGESMSLESVQRFFEDNNLELEIIETNEDTSTVFLAAKAFNINEEEIAKTMSFVLKTGEVILIVTSGNKRIDNKKYKDFFGEKAKMLSCNDVFEITGHNVGGVCPFGLKTPLKIYLDNSLKEYEYVYPAGGNANSVVKIEIELLSKITDGIWGDFVKRD